MTTITDLSTLSTKKSERLAYLATLWESGGWGEKDGTDNMMMELIDLLTEERRVDLRKLVINGAEWRPIEECPRENKKMFVVRAIDLAIPGRLGRYTSDPWCVWHLHGEFVRWPHSFDPTHFMLLPE